MPALFCLHIFAHAIPSTWDVLPILYPTGKIIQDQIKRHLSYDTSSSHSRRKNYYLFSLPIIKLHASWFMLRDIISLL